MEQKRIANSGVVVSSLSLEFGAREGFVVMIKFTEKMKSILLSYAAYANCISGSRISGQWKNQGDTDEGFCFYVFLVHIGME